MAPFKVNLGARQDSPAPLAMHFPLRDKVVFFSWVAVFTRCGPCFSQIDTITRVWYVLVCALLHHP